NWVGGGGSKASAALLTNSSSVARPIGLARWGSTAAVSKPLRPGEGGCAGAGSLPPRSGSGRGSPGWRPYEARLPRTSRSCLVPLARRWGGEEHALRPLGRQLRDHHRLREQALSSKSPSTYTNGTRTPGQQVARNAQDHR